MASSRFQALCVFCGSQSGRGDEFAAAAAGMGRLLVERGIAVVFGGGSVGLMGVLADAALEAGGQVTGVLPRGLARRELQHRGVTDTRIVASMHERKALMAELSQGFVVLPGGLGTLDETFEALTWAQLGYHDHVVGFLNVAGFFDPLFAMLEHGARHGFIAPEHLGLFVQGDQPAALLDAMEAHRIPADMKRWARFPQES